MNYPSKALVTGGAGFIGSHIVEELLENESDVVVLDDFSTGKVENLREIGAAPRLFVVKGSITDPETVRMCMKDVDAVFHEAGIVSVQQSMMDPALTNFVNVVGTRNLLRAAVDSKTCERFVFASSAAVYGNATEMPIRNKTPRRPISPYGVSKYAAARECLVTNAETGLGTVVLRYFNVYGARSSGNVVSKFLERLKKFESPVIYGDGKSTRDFVYVKDVVKANLLAASSKKAIGNAYNIATGIKHTLVELATIMRSLLLGDRLIIPIEYSAPLSGDIVESVADISRTKEDLDFEVKYPLRDGLADYFEKLFGPLPWNSNFLPPTGKLHSKLELIT